MGTELGKAFVQIVPSAEGISGAISDVLNGEADNAGKSAGGKITSTIKKAIAAAGIGKMLSDTIKEGARYEQARGGIETLFGAKGAKSVEEYAKIVKKSVGEVKGEYSKLKANEELMMKNANDAWRTAGISANDYMEQATSFAASLLQSVGGNQKKAAEAANQAVIDMSDNANKFGSNIQDIQNAYQGFAKQNYTMLDNLKLGYGGTKTEMQRLLQDAGKLTGKKYNLDNLADVYEAIHVIQDELHVTGTTGEEAATTLSGSFNAMKAAASNFMSQLVMGEDVSGAMSGLVESATTFLFDNLIPAVGNVLKNLPVVFTNSFSDVHARIIEGIQGLTESVKANLPTMIPAFMQGLLSFSSTVRERAGEFVDMGLELIKSIADGIIQNIPVFIQTVPTIISNFAGIINDNAPKILSTGVSIIKNLVVGLIQAIPVIIQNLPKIIKAIWDVFTAVNWINLGKTLISGIKNGINAIGGSLKQAAEKPITGLKNVFSNAWNAIKARAASGFNAIKTAITHPITTAKTTIKTAIDKIKGFFPLKVGKIFSSLKIPSIAVSGGKAPFGIAGKGSLPKFSVNWHAKGGVFTQPTLLNDGRDGVGEAGAEAVLPLKTLWSEMEERVGIDYNKLANALVSALSQTPQEIVVAVDGKTLVKTTAPLFRKELNNLDARNNRKLGYI